MTEFNPEDLLDPFRDPDTGEHPFKYRCSICSELVRPDDIRAHTEQERAKPTWPGYMSWERVDE